MNSWYQTAIRLDAIYSSHPEIARGQLKNHSHLLVVEGTRHVFFPVRRLADGIAGKEMDLRKSTAQEIVRYRQDLRSAGYMEISDDQGPHQVLFDRLSSLLENEFHDEPSSAPKTFWVEGGISDSKSDRSVVGSTVRTGDGSGSGELATATLRMVGPEHIQRSIDRLLSGEEATNFEASTHYDVLLPDGTRLAPKKVFGLALEAALGIEATPTHFRAGKGQVSFEIIEFAGYHIVPKPLPPAAANEIDEAMLQVPVSDGDRMLVEGNPKMVIHIRRERASGLARRKKDVFVRTHGELFCERCGIRPVEVYGAYVGEACIEVHHATVQVKDMQPGHATVLEDLQCLCANCHRITHREMLLGI